MTSIKLKLFVISVVLACMAVAGPVYAIVYDDLQSGEHWQRALYAGRVKAMTEAQWDNYWQQLQDPANEHEGQNYPSTQFLPPELYVYGGGGGGGVGHPPEPGLVMAWGDSTTPPSPCQCASAWMFDFNLDPDLSNVTITITVTAPNDPNITTISFGIQDINGNIRAWHWNVPGTIPQNVPTTVTINTAIAGVAAATPVADGYVNNPLFDITQAMYFLVDENCNWVNGPATIPPPGQTVPRPWNYWHELTVTPNPADPGLSAGINIDIHQDIDNPDIEPNDFHVKGRIESGLAGGNWSEPPVLITHIDDIFINFNCTITPDLNDPGENWYNFEASWSTDTYIPYCTILHLGLEFDVTCHNVIIDLSGWWTRDGQPIGSGAGLNQGFVPTIGFNVQDNILMPPDPIDTQVVRLQNGNLNGQQEPGEIPVEIVQMDLVAMDPITLGQTLGPDPFKELNPRGAQANLPWIPVVDPNGTTLSDSNPYDFVVDSFFDVFTELDVGGYHPIASIVLGPGDILLAREWIRFINNAGQEEYRWHFEIHEAHEQAFDLGDAPDSTNSWGAAMTAYPWGIMANYPTVYQAGSPPYGPLHLQPLRVAYLGKAVTREQEADIGADQDPSNNIIPLKNAPDRDLADDGVPGIPLKLPACKQTRFKYLVNVINTTFNLYVNVWFDWNRDGDWDDTPQCGTAAAPVNVPEWAVQNQLLAAGSLPLGLNSVATPAFYCWHPDANDEPIWMRITLCEMPWTPGGGMVGDGGSGPLGGHQYGETEDYYFTPDTGQNPNPDGNLDGIVNFLDIAIPANMWLQKVEVNGTICDPCTY